MEVTRKMKEKRINRLRYENLKMVMMGGIILKEKGNPKVWRMGWTQEISRIATSKRRQDQRALTLPTLAPLARDQARMDQINLKLMSNQFFSKLDLAINQSNNLEANNIWAYSLKALSSSISIHQEYSTTMVKDINESTIASTSLTSFCSFSLWFMFSTMNFKN